MNRPSANRRACGPGAQLRRLGAVVVSLALCTASCERDGPPLPERSPPERPTVKRRTAASALPDARELTADAATTADAAPATSASLAIRNRRLSLEPQRVPPQRLAFGTGRLARLTHQALVVIDTKRFAEERSIPLAQGRRVIALRGGGLLATATDQLVVLQPGAERPDVFAGVPLFADSLLFGDRADVGLVWLRHLFDPTLYGYRLEATAGKRLRIEGFFELDDHDARGFAALKDGSFVFTADARLHRFFPAGKRTELTLPDPGGEVWRILPARRVDRFWVAYRDGRLQLLQLGLRLRAIRTLRLPLQPFDVAANDSHIALVRLEHDPGQDRRWSLVVLDTEGKPRFTTALPNDPATAGSDWVATVAQNKEVALPPRGSLVAVGGPGWVGVWNVETGKQLLPR